MSSAVTSPEKPWHEAYPPPRCRNPASITAPELLHALKAGSKPGVDFLLVDLRRNDHEVLCLITGPTLLPFNSQIL